MISSHDFTERLAFQDIDQMLYNRRRGRVEDVLAFNHVDRMANDIRSCDVVKPVRRCPP